MSRNRHQSKRQGYSEIDQGKSDCRSLSWNLVAITEKCREYRLFALPRLHTPNEYLKSTLSTTDATLSGSMLFTCTRLDHAVVLLPHHQHGFPTHTSLLVVYCHQHIRPNHSSTILSSPSRPLALTDWTAAPETRHLVLRSEQQEYVDCFIDYPVIVELTLASLLLPASCLRLSQ